MSMANLPGGTNPVPQPGGIPYNPDAVTPQRPTDDSVDFGSLINPQPSMDYQGLRPPFEIEWLPDKTPRNTKAFRLTYNSWIEGLYPQRGALERNYASIAASEGMVTHVADGVTLAFKTETQSPTGLTSNAGGILHTVFQGRLVMARQDGSCLWYETSVNDPTLLTRQLASYQRITCLATLVFNAREYLAVAFQAEPVRIYDDFGVTLFAFFDLEQVRGMQQSPLPGAPLAVNNAGAYYLLDPPAFTPDFSTSGNLMTFTQQSAGALGSMPLGGRPARMWWLEFQGNTPQRVVSTDAWCTNYEVLELSIRNVMGATLLKRRGAIAAHDYNRVIIHDGAENDTRIFRDLPPVSGYTYVVAGLWSMESDLFADVNLVPNDLLTALHTSLSTLNVIRQVWRFDFDRWKWSPVSEKTEYQPSSTPGSYGLFQNGIIGHITAWPRPDLPFSPVTHNLWATSLTGDNPIQHKFEPPASQSPYSFRSRKTFAANGRIRLPESIWPPGTEHLPKEFTAVEWNGEVGGANSTVQIKIAEGGTLDTLTTDPLQHTFVAALPNVGRRQEFPDARTLYLYPQIEIVAVQGDTTTSTPQLLPFSIEGLVHFPERKPDKHKWQFWRRG